MHTALRELAAMRPMPVGVDADGAYFITLPGGRWLRGDADDDNTGEEPDDAA